MKGKQNNFSLHSGVNTMGLHHSNEERELNAGVLINEGEWAGWKLYGPYIKRSMKKKGGITEYYMLRKGTQRKFRNVADIDVSNLVVTKVEKPFLDWIR